MISTIVYIVSVVTVIAYLVTIIVKRKVRKQLQTLRQRLEEMPDQSLGLSQRTIVLNSNLTLSFCDTTGETGGGDQATVGRRSLAVIFGWMFADERHLEKFRRYYYDKGFDVLSVRTHVWDPLVPSAGAQIVAQGVCDCLQTLTSRFGYKQYVWHVFSIGTYQSGEVFVRLCRPKNESLAVDVKHRLRAVIVDSGIDVCDAPLALAMASTQHWWLRLAIIGIMNWYSWAADRQVARHWRASSDTFKRWIRCPVAYFISEKDAAANPANTRTLIDRWKNAGQSVNEYWSARAAHVDLYREDPEKYVKCLDEFFHQHHIA